MEVLLTLTRYTSQNNIASNLKHKVSLTVCCVHELMTFQSAFRLELFSTEVTKMRFLSTVSVHVSFEVAFTS